MNLILLFPDDFTSETRARLTGRRREHVLRVHRAQVGEELTVGIANGRIGRARVTSLDPLELGVIALDRDPPPALPMTLVVALPRPKVVNRLVAASASLGIRSLYFINAWRVEKSYWSSPRLTPENLGAQSILGVEQARDTVLPKVELRRFFRRFVEDELPAIAANTLRLAAHPHTPHECPRNVAGPVTLVLGPEGGFIDAELASLERAGFALVTLGERILRTETALGAVVGRLF